MKSYLIKTAVMLLSMFSWAGATSAAWVDHGTYATHVESQTHWLKTSQTVNMTYNDVSATYLSSGWLVSGGATLFSALGFNDDTVLANNSEFISALGATKYIGGVSYLEAFCCDDFFYGPNVALGTETYVILQADSVNPNHAHISSSTAYSDIGFLLYRPAVAVPEAETYAMLLAGLGLVGLAVRRRKIGQG